MNIIPLPIVSFNQPSSTIDKSQTQKVFITKFCNEIEQYLKETSSYVNFSTNQFHTIDVFLKQLQEGMGIIKGQEEMCQAVFEFIQAAFENLLASKLKSGEIKKVDVFFLENLPYAPLCHPLQEMDTAQVEWKEWIPQKLRDLRNAGATLRMIYSDNSHQKLSENCKTKFETYELEKKQSHLYNYCLPIAIPEELIGAFYVFTDKEENTYQFMTQESQIAQHGEAIKCSKIWFEALSPNKSEASSRTIEMLMLVNRYIDALIHD